MNIRSDAELVEDICALLASWWTCSRAAHLAEAVVVEDDVSKAVEADHAVVAAELAKVRAALQTTPPGPAASPASPPPPSPPLAYTWGDGPTKYVDAAAAGLVCVGDLRRHLAEARGLPPSERLRLKCDARDLRDDQPLSDVDAATVHVMLGGGLRGGMDPDSPKSPSFLPMPAPAPPPAEDRASGEAVERAVTVPPLVVQQSPPAIGVRLGPGADGLPLKYIWWHRHMPVGNEGVIVLNNGDVYIMSEAAVGTDSGKSSLHTLRHAAGREGYPFAQMANHDAVTKRGAAVPPVRHWQEGRWEELAI